MGVRGSGRLVILVIRRAHLAIARFGGVDKVFDAIFFHQVIGQLFDLGLQLRLSVGDERERAARRPHACRAADAVDVDLGVFGDVIVDDVGDFVDVDTTGGQVSGDQHMDFAGFKAAHHAFAFVLHEVAVDGGGGDAIFDEAGGDLVHAALGAAEDQGKGGFFLAHQHARAAALVPRLHADVILRRFGVGEVVRPSMP